MKRPLVLGGIAVAATAAIIAYAATPDSWAALDKDAHAACGKEIVRLASKAKVTGTAGKISGIGIGNEGDRHYGLILTGTTGVQEPVAVPL